MKVQRKERLFWLGEGKEKWETKQHVYKWFLGNPKMGISHQKTCGRWGGGHGFEGTGLPMACFDHAAWMSVL